MSTAARTARKTIVQPPRKPKIVVRTSGIHGRGVYAGRNLKKGERIIEYKGEVITWREADRRPPSDADDPNHTFFFSLDDVRHVIDRLLIWKLTLWPKQVLDLVMLMDA